MSIQPFISRLKEAIEECPASQGTIADHVGVSRQSVTNWKNTGQISTENLKKLSEVTGYRYVWLKEGTGTKKFSDSDQNDAEFHLAEKVIREERPESGYMGDEVSDLIKSIRYAVANKKLNPDSIKALTLFVNTLVNSK
ncbi:helix-turn-helix domain-containing protein [Marinobacter shengliensis]|uniref:Helix-turn-helix domain-containing protein n=2 Tax=Marinobacter shengliensis TaxID=1389223 RepID=A0ABV4W4K8_9GAMM